MSNKNFKENNIKKIEPSYFHRVTGGMNMPTETDLFYQIGTSKYDYEIVRLSFGNESFSDDYNNFNQIYPKRDNIFVRPRTFVNTKKGKK